MKTIEERAQDYAKVIEANYPKLVAFDYAAGAREEHILLTEWHDIEKDKDGFATDKAYEEITASLPILVKDVVWNEMFVVDKNNLADWSGDFQTHPSQYKWRKIHE